MIRNIIFDVGNVLVDFRWEGAMRDHGFDGERLERLRRATLNSAMWGELDRSEIPDEEILAGFIKNDPEIEEDIRLMWQYNREMIRCYEGAEEWVRSFKEKGCHCYILSNYSRYTYELTREELAFEKIMDGSLFSFQVRQVKPERAIFETLLKKYALKPEECAFLDDSPVNVEAAKALGIHGIVFHSRQQAQEELKKLGVE